MKNELWNDIPGYEGIYQVSNMGRVKSLDRVVYTRGCIPCKWLKGQIMKSFLMDGYERICLSKQGTQRKFWVHRLVAMAFIPNPENLPEINHIDENPTNNNVWNLEWSDRLHNIRHGTRTARMAISQGRKVVQYSLNNQYLREFVSLADAARYIGGKASSSGIRQACIGSVRQIYGYKWKFKDEQTNPN